MNEQDVLTEIRQRTKKIKESLDFLSTCQPEKEVAPKKIEPRSFLEALEQGLLTLEEYGLLKRYCDKIGQKVYWSWKYSVFAHGHPYLEATSGYPEPNQKEERLLVFLAKQGIQEAQDILAHFLLRYVIKWAVVFAYFGQASAKNLAWGLKEENFEEYVGQGQLALGEVLCDEIKNFRHEARLATYVGNAIRDKIIDYIRKQMRRRAGLEETPISDDITLGRVKKQRFEQIKNTLFVVKEPDDTITESEIALVELEQLLTWAIAAFVMLGKEEGAQQKSNAIVLRLLDFRFKEIEQVLGWSSDEAARSCVRRAVDEGGLADMPPAAELKEVLVKNRFTSGQLEQRLAGLLSGIEFDSCVLRLKSVLVDAEPELAEVSEGD